MPHVNIEFSSNLDREIEPQKLVEVIHKAALDLGTFPFPGLKTRAQRVELFAIADGDPINAFIHITVRMSGGTAWEKKRRAAEALLARAVDFLGSVYESRPMSITVEVLELDRELHLRKNNIEIRMKEAGSAGD